MAAPRRIRLETARASLADGDRPASIRAVNAVYRFTNSGRFARLFKEAFGRFPSELRQNTDSK